jgi:hypothetical protein
VRVYAIRDKFFKRNFIFYGNATILKPVPFDIRNYILIAFHSHTVLYVFFILFFLIHSKFSRIEFSYSPMESSEIFFILVY